LRESHPDRACVGDFVNTGSKTNISQEGIVETTIAKELRQRGTENMWQECSLSGELF